MIEPDACLKHQRATVVRDPLARPEAVHAARQRPMAERLELALSWNELASQLRAGIADAIRRPAARP
jgi:hypothetical protein